jgi:hypothetical protein
MISNELLMRVHINQVAVVTNVFAWFRGLGVNAIDG